MRRKFDKNIIQLGIMLFLVVVFGLLFYYLVFNNKELGEVGKKLINVFTPVIIGVFIAYILNPIMVKIENHIINPFFNKVNKGNKKVKKSTKRGISVLLSMIVFILFMYLMVIMVVPQVINSIETIIERFPSYFVKINRWANELLDNNPVILELFDQYTENVQQWFMDSLVPKIQQGITDLSGNIIGGVFSVISALLNTIIGIIISVYLLMNKEVYCAQAKKIAYALLREERANNLINNTRFANKMFGGFLSGKILDSLIIGLLCFIVMTLFQIPYPLLISVIIGVTNIIPFFGPFIGAIPSAIIILMMSPIKCLTFIIMVLLLQQIDGNIIGPKILGDSTGLSSFWVIFAITLFGGYFGVFGMFIGVPLFAVIYAAIKTFINQRLEKKELPVETSFYIDSDYHSDEEILNAGSEIKFVKKTFDNIYVEGKKKVVKVTTDTVTSTTQEVINSESENNNK